jgi:hypothetical protein
MSDDTLPRRSPMPWLPHLDELAHFDPEWVYRDSDGAEGVAVLRVWRAGPGHFAVVTEKGLGRSVTNAARAIRATLAAQYGEPLTLAEHWPLSQAPEAGEHVDLVLPATFNGGQGWSPLHPVGSRHPHAEILTAWWLAYGDQITDIPA